MRKPKVVMMGLGYIGLPTAALIASKDIDVAGVDISRTVVDTINKGEIHIVEPDLEGLVSHVVKNGSLKAGTKPVEADVFLVAVPTPFKGDHEPDISFVESATRMIIPFLREGNLYILESTSPVGTTDKMAGLIYKERPELKGKINIAYCPERVLPGRVIYELENNDRSIGGVDEASTEKAVEFYSLFVKGALHKTNAKTAEMCKLVENSYRDVSVAFANELSMICDKAGINVWELIRLANKHPRVKILSPGAGVGGHCIAVDPWFIVSDYPLEARLIRTGREVNNHKSVWVKEKIRDAAEKFEKENKKKPVIACMGLAFKPDIDDLRESPALHITKDLKAMGLNVLAVEPNIREHSELELTDYQSALKQADIIVFLVAHKEFKGLKITGKVVIDLCGVMNG
jgi:UDP-N-acetyl-D-mannosaminuronic acid dehydrogenase